MRIILHIGVEKTGTTSLQHFFADNRDALRAQGVLYPVLFGATDNQSSLAAYALNDQRFDDVRALYRVHDQASLDRFRQEFPDALRRSVEKARPQTLLLSSEHLSSRLHTEEETARLAEVLTALSSDIEIVVYLRPQEEFFLSSYITFVKSGQTTPIPLKGPVINNRNDYWKVLARWRASFDRAAFHIRTYERETLEGGDIVEDFCRQVGLEGLLALPRPRRLNEALCIDTLEFLRLFNAHVPRRTEAGFNPHRHTIVAQLEAIAGDERPRLSDTLITTIRQRFKPTNRMVARKLLGREDGKLFRRPRFGSDETVVNRPLSPERAVEISAALWSNNVARILELEAAAKRGASPEQEKSDAASAPEGRRSGVWPLRWR